MLKRPKKNRTTSNQKGSRSRSSSREPSSKYRSERDESNSRPAQDPHKLYNNATKKARQQSPPRGRRKHSQSPAVRNNSNNNSNSNNHNNHNNNNNNTTTNNSRSRSTSQHKRPQKLPKSNVGRTIQQQKQKQKQKHKSAEEKILAATSNSRASNEKETDLDYESLQNYIDELKHKMHGTGGASSTVTVHQLSKVKKRIFDAMTHEQKVAAMLKQGSYKPSSNLMKGAMPTRKKHVSNGSSVEPKSFTKKSAGNIYNQAAVRRSGSGNGQQKNQWGDWLDEMESEGLKWLEKNATYCRPGPASGNMQRAFNNYGNEEASEAGDPYASLRGTILVLRKVKRRQLKPGQKIRRAKPKVRLGRDTQIRNDGRR